MHPKNPDPGGGWAKIIGGIIAFLGISTTKKQVDFPYRDSSPFLAHFCLVFKKHMIRKIHHILQVLFLHKPQRYRCC